MLRISDSVDQNQNDILSFDKKCVFISILSSYAREDVVIVKNENKVSGIKLRVDVVIWRKQYFETWYKN